MRTTVTLDPDVERLIRNAMRARAISFKQALNEAARIGLRGKQNKRTRKFTQNTFRMGEGQEFRWDKALAVADSIEDEGTQPKAQVSQSYWSRQARLGSAHVVQRFVHFGHDVNSLDEATVIVLYVLV